MLTITRRLFKMFLLLSHINARIDPNILSEWIHVLLATVSNRGDCSLRTERKKRFKTQRALKLKCRVQVLAAKRQGDFNDAVGLQVALLIGSDRGAAILRRRSPTARTAYVRRAVDFSIHFTVG